MGITILHRKSEKKQAGCFQTTLPINAVNTPVFGQKQGNADISRPEKKVSNTKSCKGPLERKGSSPNCRVGYDNTQE